MRKRPADECRSHPGSHRQSDPEGLSDQMRPPQGADEHQGPRGQLELGSGALREGRHHNEGQRCGHGAGPAETVAHGQQDRPGKHHQIGDTPVIVARSPFGGGSCEEGKEPVLRRQIHGGQSRTNHQRHRGNEKGGTAIRFSDRPIVATEGQEAQRSSRNQRHLHDAVQRRDRIEAPHRTRCGPQQECGAQPGERRIDADRRFDRAGLHDGQDRRQPEDDRRIGGAVDKAQCRQQGAGQGDRKGGDLAPAGYAVAQEHLGRAVSVGRRRRRSRGLRGPGAVGIVQ